VSWLETQMGTGDPERLKTPWITIGQTKETISREEALAAVKRHQVELHRAGLAPGERVLLGLSHPIHFITAWFAIMDMGAVAVPVSPLAPAAEWDRIHNSIGLAAAVIDQTRTDLLHTPPPYASIFTDPEGRMQATRPVTPSPSRYASPGVVLFTSGSTGEPKPVGLSLATLMQAAQHVVDAHHLMPRDVGYCPLPLFHVNAEVIGVLSSLVAQSALVVDSGLSRAGFWDLIDQVNATWINLVPTLITLLIKDPESKPKYGHRIRFIRSASAPLPDSVRKTAETKFEIPIVQSYGISEAAGPVTVESTRHVLGTRGGVGRPWGVAVKILPHPSGHGEIVVGGPRVMDPEWGPNAWIQNRLTDGWYHTGDLGHFDASGLLHVDGRIKDVINRGGEQIFPGEIEDILLTHPKVRECAVIGQPNPVLGEEVVAVIATDDLVAIEDELRRLAEADLSPFKRPVRYTAIDALPKNRTGKIRRDVLRQCGQSA
jgi:acyl-CoA synthetase (AMP-forming)/AMP-acid ligase II